VKPYSIDKSNSRSSLTEQQAQSLLATYGLNQLPQQKPVSIFHRFIRQFTNALIYILLAALVIDLVLWWFENNSKIPIDALAIATILILNASLGVWQETKAENALAKLETFAVQNVWTMRDDKLKKIARHFLVPGDLIRLQSGERVPADLILVDDEELIVDESVITGESEPVSKSLGAELFAGTLLVKGKGYFRVKRTGRKSTLGKLASLLSSLDDRQTPLEKRLQRFGQQIGIAVVLIAMSLLLLGLLVEGLSSFNQMFLFAVALAVAAVPEGLPAIISLTLALGVERMSKRKAVVRKMAAVEALGSVTVIATDKTGTLTENKMHVSKLLVNDETLAFRAMSLANDAEVDSGAGDPLEQGLYRYLIEQSVDPAKLQHEFPRLSSQPFDSKEKFMRVSVKQAGNYYSYYKGAPEVLMNLCRMNEKQRISQQQLAHKYARRGFRLLALAWSEDDSQTIRSTHLNWIGLVVLQDPARPEVPEAVKQAQLAGIRVMMLTGDHPATALSIAQQIGIKAEQVITGEEFEKLTKKQRDLKIETTNVFARVKPEHKLAIVKTLQQQQQTVAVTGDGVNDAPALKAADVGVAMGQRGSDVSREVADIVLMDDNFASIVAAIEEGRSIYENIKKYIRILFSTNLAEILLVAFGTVIAIVTDIRDENANLLLPLLAVQILWINLLTDSFPALTVALDKNPNLMAEKPTPTTNPLLDRSAMIFTVAIGGFIGLVSLFLFWWLPTRGFDLVLVQTAVFTYLTLSQLSVIIPARKTVTQPKPNHFVLLAILICFSLQMMVLNLEVFNEILHITMLSQTLLFEIGGLIFASWLFAEIISRQLRHRYKSS
jgi:P-type Ca2+ transporter type 2C